MLDALKYEYRRVEFQQDTTKDESIAIACKIVSIAPTK